MCRLRNYGLSSGHFHVFQSVHYQNYHHFFMSQPGLHKYGCQATVTCTFCTVILRILLFLLDFWKIFALLVSVKTMDPSRYHCSIAVIKIKYTCLIVAASNIFHAISYQKQYLFIEFRINSLNMINVSNMCLCAMEWLKLKKAPSRHADQLQMY